MSGQSAFLAPDEVRRIAARAATLDERLASAAERRGRGNAPTVGEDARRVLDAWARAYAPGNPQAFQRRLEWDGIDPREAAQAFSDLAASSEAPVWTGALRSFLAEAALLAAQLRRGEPIGELDACPASSAPPFRELWVSVVRAAARRLADGRERLLQRVGLAARRAFEDQLLKELPAHAELAVFAAFEEFRASREESGSQHGEPCVRETGVRETGGKLADGVYKAFVLWMLEEGLKDVFSTYPVLARHLALIADGWISSTSALLERLDADRRALAETFFEGRDLGDLVAVEPGLSDRHNGGRRVAVLDFGAPVRLVYKPRPVGLEQAYNELLVWVRDHGLESAPRALRGLARDGYGWAEFVTPGALATDREASVYFRRAGALLCITWLLRAKDLHMENVIAAPESPVVIDAEMLAQPVATHANNPVEPTDQRPLEESCLSTGLLSVLEPLPSGHAHDVGGLRGSGGGTAPLEKRVWRHLGTDSLRYELTREFTPALDNRVVVAGTERLPEEFAADVTAGFSDAYEFFLRRREDVLAPGGPLDRLAASPVRVLFRPTTQYAAMLYVLAGPRYQCSGTTRGIALDTLNRSFAGAASEPSLWPVVGAERRALERLDIPHFVLPAAGKDVDLGEGTVLEGYFERSGWEAIVERINGCCDADLQRQTGFLSWALANTSDSRFVTPLPDDRHTPDGDTRETPVGDRRASQANRRDSGGAEAGSTMVECAVWIGEEMLARARRGPDDALEWPVPPWQDDAGEGLGAWNLFSGRAGAALLFAALHAIDGGERWRESAEAAARPLLDVAATGDRKLDGAPIGGCEGVGSLVWTLTWLGRLLQQPCYIDNAVRYAATISKERIESDSRLDVVAGSAGAILALLTLHRDHPDEALLSTAITAGRHLLDRAVETENGGLAWPVEGATLAGFAHGAAGIGYALARLAGVAGREELLDAALRAVRFEASLFSPQRGNWRIAGSRPSGPAGDVEWMTAWCHGAPGVALARCMALDVLRTDEIVEEIGAAMRTTAGYAGGRWDHLCCGALGRSDAMLTAGLGLGVAEWQTSAVDVAASVCDRARQSGRFSLPSSPFECRVFVPGFFHGLAGIGYQLLRTTAPKRLPSVLGLQT